MNDHTAIARRAATILAACLALVSRLNAAEPTISDLNPRGLQVGGSTTIILDGDELGTAPRLLLPFPAKSELKPGGTANRATFDVTLDGTVLSGYHNARVVTEGGASLPVVIGVDRLPQRPLPPTLDQLPIAVTGTAGGSKPVETKFAGKAGQKILIEVEAQRLGSKLRPIVHLYNPRGRQIAWAWMTPALFGDVRLEATLAEDGDHTIAVHDSEYAPPGPSFFRLKVGQWSFVDRVYPPFVAKGQPRAVEFLGLPAALRLDLPAPSTVGILPLAWPAEGVWSGPRPFVRVSSRSEWTEEAPPPLLPLGAHSISGRLLADYEEDKYIIAVAPGGKVRLEVFAERLGSQLDAALNLSNTPGNVLLAAAEDSPGSLDPLLEYTVPATVTVMTVGVRDVQGHGGPRSVYRLLIDTQPQANPESDFSLTTPAQRLALPIAGRDVFPILVERRGYAGAVEIAAAGLSAGTRLENTSIPEGADGTLVTVHRGDAAADTALTTWTGRTPAGDERPLSFKGHPLEKLQPWLATEFAVAPTTRNAADFQIDWRNLPTDAGLVPAGKLALPVKLVRPADNSLVRLTLVTSQLPPLVNGQPDPNRSLRQETPVELAANVLEGAVTILLPADMPAPVYDATVQADLLSADRRVVLASAFAPVRRLPIRMPIVVQLAAAPRIEVSLDPQKGATVPVQGKIERREGLTGDVVVALTGLPPGARADAFTVKADAVDFTLNIILPANVPAGELKGLKLSASGVPDPKQPNIRVKTRDVELVLVVQPAPAAK